MLRSFGSWIIFLAMFLFGFTTLLIVSSVVSLNVIWALMDLSDVENVREKE